jgi:uncharacterized membrane protein
MFQFNLTKLLLSAITLVSIDSVYLQFIKNFFSNQIKLVQQMPMELNFVAAILSYILLVFGINYFIIQPNRSIQDAFLLGLIIYGVFETTNKALFNNWSWVTVFIDTLWGGVLFGLTTFFTSYIVKLLQ